MSWTDSIVTAEWFAHRYDRNGQKGYVEAASVNKSDILAYFNSRSESEIVVNTFNLKPEHIKIISDLE